MAWTKVVTESSSGNIAQKAATAGVADSITSQGALATLNSVAAGQIDANAVEASEIASGAVGYEELASNSVITAKIADSNVTNAKMADDAIGIAELSASGTAGNTTFLRGDNAWVVPTDISTVANLTDTTITGTPANNEVLAYDTSEGAWINQTLVEAGIQPTLGSGDVTSSMIGQGTVALSNMANLAANTFIGRDTESTGVPEALSVSAVKTMLSLNNVDNTADSAKPVSSAQATSIATKALLAGDTSQNFSTNDLSVTGDLLVSGDTVTVNVGTITVEDKNIQVASGAGSLGAASGAGLSVKHGVVTSAEPELQWIDTGTTAQNLTGWNINDNGDTGHHEIAVMSFSTADATGSGAGVGSFHYDTSGDNLWLRTS